MMLRLRTVVSACWMVAAVSTAQGLVAAVSTAQGFDFGLPTDGVKSRWETFERWAGCGYGDGYHACRERPDGCGDSLPIRPQLAAGRSGGGCSGCDGYAAPSFHGSPCDGSVGCDGPSILRPRPLGGELMCGEVIGPADAVGGCCPAPAAKPAACDATSCDGCDGADGYHQLLSEVDSPASTVDLLTRDAWEASVAAAETVPSYLRARATSAEIRMAQQRADEKVRSLNR